MQRQCQNPYYAQYPRTCCVVGYQTQGYDRDQYSLAAATFAPVSGDMAAMTLESIKPNEDFCESQICFLKKSGANARVEFGGKTVDQSYVYWTSDDDPSDGAGWYLVADEDATVNQNKVEIPFGEGFLVYRMTSEVDAGLTYAGAVCNKPITKGFAHDQYNMCGNCSPVEITLGDITPNEEFCESQICFLKKSGANARVEFAGKTVDQSYVYWTADDDPSAGAGWYLVADEDATINQNGVKIAAGEGFLVYRMTSEPDAELTIPSAL